MTNPVPLELSFNWCSHNCHYCFANLNKPDRFADIKATMRLLSNYQDRKSLEAEYLRWRLPTLISNRVDPFANTNEKQVLPILEMMTDLDLPMSFQTKGGRSLDKALEFLKPAAWYISIAFNDSDTAAKVEPGAPSIESRIDLCTKLRALGHKVNVGINPCASEFLPRPEELVKKLADAGVHGAWIEVMHFSRDQIKNIPPAGMKALTPELVAKYSKRSGQQSDVPFLDRVRNICKDNGLAVFTMGDHEPSAYFDEYPDVYESMFPIYQWFLNDCHEQLEDGDLITIDTYLDYFLPQLPEGRFSLGRYIAMSRSAMKAIGKAEFSNNLTFKELLTYSWNIPQVKFSPARCFAFAYAVQDGVQVVDGNGAPVMVFCKNGTDQLFREV